MTSKTLPTAVVLAPTLILALALMSAGCDTAPAEASEAAAVPDPAAVAHELRELAVAMDLGGDVTTDHFERALAPFKNASFERWEEEELRQVISALHRVRTALQTRYRTEDTFCTEDSWTLYSSCQAGPSCVARVQVAELRCLWFFSH